MIFNNDIKTKILGGGIISITSSLNLLLIGRPTSVSSSFFKTIRLKEPLTHISFFFGMILLSSIFYLFYDKWMYFYELRILYPLDLSVIGFIICGFLVGFGSKMTKGCLSMHSLNGIGSLNLRSLIIVVVMFISSFIFSHLKKKYNLFEYYRDIDSKIDQWFNDNVNYAFFYCSFIFEIIIGIYFIVSKNIKEFISPFLYFLSGICFSYGELLLNLAKRHNVFDSFLIFNKNWNYDILVGIISAILINLFLYQLILQFLNKPLIINNSYKLVKKKTIDTQLFVGAIIYGAGIGISGIFPGSCILICYAYMPRTLIYIAMIGVGQYFAFFLDKCFFNSSDDYTLNDNLLDDLDD